MQTNNPKLTCEVCGNDVLIPVLDLGAHPMCDDLVPVGDDWVCKEYPIEIVYCDTCKTAHQRFDIPKRELFPSSYHYRSRFTADVLNGMASLVKSCQTHFGLLRQKLVVDVGCNDGSLLSMFRDQGANTIGIEPTGAARDAMEKGHVIYNEYLSEALANRVRNEHGIPDFIVFTNVFAHIENLNEVLSALRILKGQQTVVVVENHYLGAVLEGSQFDTFYHEHPRTYSYKSFKYVAEALGISLLGVEFPARYGGNIRVFMGSAANRAMPEFSSHVQIEQCEAKFLTKFAALRSNIASWKSRKSRIINESVARFGPIRGKAFPGRAAILIKILGLDHNVISAVYEKPGSMKIGHYIPGTRIPILSDEELFSSLEQKKPLLNLAWHISDEIRRYLVEHDYHATVIDIIDKEDFNSFEKPLR
jgi:SAM-dependent methyltransferase